MTQKLIHHQEASQEIGIQSPYNPKDKVKYVGNATINQLTQIIHEISYHLRISIIKRNYQM